MTADHIGGHRFPAQAGKVVAVWILLNATFHVKHARNFAFSNDVSSMGTLVYLKFYSLQDFKTLFFFSILNWSIRFLHAIFTCTSRQFLIQTPKILRRIMNGEIFECFRARSMFFIHHDPSSRDSCKICSHHTLFILDSYRKRAPVFKGNVARRSVSTIKGMTRCEREMIVLFSRQFFLYTRLKRVRIFIFIFIFRYSCFRVEILNGDASLYFRFFVHAR